MQKILGSNACFEYIVYGKCKQQRDGQCRRNHPSNMKLDIVVFKEKNYVDGEKICHYLLNTLHKLKLYKYYSMIYRCCAWCAQLRAKDEKIKSKGNTTNRNTSPFTVAAKYYRKSIGHDFSRANYLTHREYAMLLSNEFNNFTKAKNHFRRSIDIQPKDSESRALYGCQLFKNDDFKEAAIQLKKATQLSNGSNVVYCYWYGLSLMKLGNFTQAVAEFRRALTVIESGQVLEVINDQKQRWKKKVTIELFNAIHDQDSGDTSFGRFLTVITKFNLDFDLFIDYIRTTNVSPRFKDEYLSLMSNLDRLRRVLLDSNNNNATNMNRSRYSNTNDDLKQNTVTAYVNANANNSNSIDEATEKEKEKEKEKENINTNQISPKATSKSFLQKLLAQKQKLLQRERQNSETSGDTGTTIGASNDRETGGSKRKTLIDSLMSGNVGRSKLVRRGSCNNVHMIGQDLKKGKNEFIEKHVMADGESKNMEMEKQSHLKNKKVTTTSTHGKARPSLIIDTDVKAVKGLDKNGAITKNLTLTPSCSRSNSNSNSDSNSNSNGQSVSSIFTFKNGYGYGINIEESTVRTRDSPLFRYSNDDDDEHDNYNHVEIQQGEQATIASSNAIVGEDSGILVGKSNSSPRSTTWTSNSFQSYNQSPTIETSALGSCDAELVGLPANSSKKQINVYMCIANDVNDQRGAINESF